MARKVTIVRLPYKQLLMQVVLAAKTWVFVDGYGKPELVPITSPRAYSMVKRNRNNLPACTIRPDGLVLYPTR